MYDVFISYPRQHRAKAEPFRKKLEGMGLSVFFDLDSIDSGAEFPDSIDRALSSAKAVLSCWSPTYFTRRWCLIESRVGLDRGVLVPISIDPFDKDNVPADLRFINFFDLSVWAGEDHHEDWQRTLRSLGRLTGVDLLGSLETIARSRKEEEIAAALTRIVWRGETWRVGNVLCWRSKHSELLISKTKFDWDALSPKQKRFFQAEAIPTTNEVFIWGAAHQQNIEDVAKRFYNAHQIAEAGATNASIFLDQADELRFEPPWFVDHGHSGYGYHDLVCKQCALLHTDFQFDATRSGRKVPLECPNCSLGRDMPPWRRGSLQGG